MHLGGLQGSAESKPRQAARGSDMTSRSHTLNFRRFRVQGGFFMRIKNTCTLNFRRLGVQGLTISQVVSARTTGSQWKKNRRYQCHQQQQQSDA